MKWLALALAVSTPALAEVPGGHVYFGAGGYWSIPTESGGHPWSASRQDFALSLDLAYEFQRAFVAVGVAAGGFQVSQPMFVMYYARGGYIFGGGSIAPYLSLGLGGMAETAFSPYDEGTQLSSSGATLLGEAGVLLFRDQRIGRVALSAQLVQPLFHLSVGYIYGASGTLGVVLLGVRIFG